MRPDERDAGYLLDMIEHTRVVVRALQGRTLDDYVRDEDLRLAVVNADSEIPIFADGKSPLCWLVGGLSRY